jgi:hypothetical protein
LIGNAAAAVDRAATLAAYAGSTRARKKSRAESLGHQARLEALAAIAKLYPSDAAGYFREPQPIEPSLRSARPIGSAAQAFDLAWPSKEATFVGEIEPRYGRFVENRVAAARLFLHREPRPVAVLVHGYLGGQFAMKTAPVVDRGLKSVTRVAATSRLSSFVRPLNEVRSVTPGLRDMSSPLNPLTSAS